MILYSTDVPLGFYKSIWHAQHTHQTIKYYVNTDIPNNGRRCGNRLSLQETVANNVDDLCASYLDELRGAYNPRKVGKQVTRQRDSPDRRR